MLSRLMTIKDLFLFILVRRRLWWLAPLLLALIVFSLIIALGSVLGVGPLMYSLF